MSGVEIAMDVLAVTMVLLLVTALLFCGDMYRFMTLIYNFQRDWYEEWRHNRLMKPPQELPERLRSRW